MFNYKKTNVIIISKKTKILETNNTKYYPEKYCLKLILKFDGYYLSYVETNGLMNLFTLKIKQGTETGNRK